MVEYVARQVGEDGLYVDRDAFDCRDDGHAVFYARRFVRELDVHVWCGDRFVFTLERKSRSEGRS